MKSDEVICSHIIAPVKPSALCTASPCVLFFGIERAIWGINCSVIPPRAHTSPVFDGCGYTIKDMLYVDQEDDDQLLVTNYPGEIHVYNLGTKHLLWKLTDRIPDSQDKISCGNVATDGRGHLFVSDVENACIRVFAVDGTYRGSVVLLGKQEDLGTLLHMRWSSCLCALIVVHNKRGKFSKISVIKIE